MIRWREVDSSNVKRIGWPSTGEPLMLVEFKNGRIYGYEGVSRQRAVALVHRRRLWNGSIGQYMNKRVKPRFTVVEIRDAA